MKFAAESIEDRERSPKRSVRIHPAWAALIRYCQALDHGEVQRLKIQDGLPVLAEVTTKKVKFS